MNPPGDDYAIDKRLARAAFDRAAPDYEASAALQRMVGERLRERLEWIRLEPALVVDAGCGPGSHTGWLERHYPKARVLALDLSTGMLAEARKRARRWFGRQRFACGDLERLPLADHAVDLLFSNLALQWCNDLDAVFAEFARVLRPGGLLLFSTFGPDTLRELRGAFGADGHVHVHRFVDLHDVGDALLRAGLQDPVTDIDRIVETFPNARAVMRSLKAIGAHNAAAGRPQGLTGPARLRAVERAYETHRRPDGLLPATYEVVYGAAWGRAALGRTGTEVPLGALRRGA